MGARCGRGAGRARTGDAPDIRENNLADERRKVAARVRLGLADEDATVVSEIVQTCWSPTASSIWSAPRNAARLAQLRSNRSARRSSATRSSLRSGDIVTEQDVEALRALGLQQSGWSWRSSRCGQFRSCCSLPSFSIISGGRNALLWLRTRQMLLIAFAFIVFTLTVKAMLPAARALLHSCTVRSAAHHSGDRREPARGTGDDWSVHAYGRLDLSRQPGVDGVRDVRRAGGCAQAAAERPA